MNNNNLQVAFLQRGSTLIEILVSMMILAFAVMAILAMQVRTSAGIKEAENMGIVTQAVQNLAEDMSISPALSFDANSKITAKSYNDYAIARCEANADYERMQGAFENRAAFVNAVRAQFCGAMARINGISGSNVSVVDGVITASWTISSDGTTADGKTYTYRYVLDN